MKLTKKQQLVYNYIAEYLKTHDESPSYREVAAGLGLSSVSSVAEHIDNLVALGALKRNPGAARSLEAVDLLHTETTALFSAKLLTATDEEREILEKAAQILDLDLAEQAN
jgi:repressor LexA